MLIRFKNSQEVIISLNQLVLFCVQCAILQDHGSHGRHGAL